jgi:hypothetical protein
MDLIKLDQQILNNRGNVAVLDSYIAELKVIKSTLDWQINKFLSEYCKGVTGLALTELDTSSNIYRFYNHKCGQYSQVERLIRIATAYKK